MWDLSGVNIAVDIVKLYYLDNKPPGDIALNLNVNKTHIKYYIISIRKASGNNRFTAYRAIKLYMSLRERVKPIIMSNQCIICNKLFKNKAASRSHVYRTHRELVYLTIRQVIEGLCVVGST